MSWLWPPVVFVIMVWTFGHKGCGITMGMNALELSTAKGWVTVDSIHEHECYIPTARGWVTVDSIHERELATYGHLLFCVVDGIG